ncbi:MAG: glycosyltransferase [Nitrospirota bacterium]|nr:glycosyltransferase [Nitrospirota bacterium]
MNHILLQITLPFLVSFVIQFIVIKNSRIRSFCIDRADTDKPQRFHYVPTPRAGGLGIVIALVVGLWMFGKEGEYLVLSALPAFVIGFYEDLTSNISPKLRLSVIMAGAVVAMVLMDSIVYDIGLMRMPLWMAIPFTLIAVTGLSNAINIIDGFNGLAAGVSVILLLSFAAVSYIYGDQLILGVSTVLIVAIAGFFAWNFPRGRIFLGDGGAYFIGFILAEISILLVKRNPGISPWFPLVVLAYPVFEVFFSLYRKKFKRGLSAFKPDRVHFHMLVHSRIARNNPKTSVYIWVLVAAFNIMAFPFHSNTPVLIFIFFLFSATYLYLYRRIVRFKK